MARESAIVFSGIAPHPPIMVPDVGGEAVAQVQASIDAMAEFARRVILSGAETVVLISPHAPLDARTFVAYHSPTLHGDFANFRAASTQVEFPLDEQLLETISKTAAEDEYEVTNLKSQSLDHGTAVPLYFLDRVGWRGRVVALGYSFLANEDHLRFGACIRKAVDTAGRAVAFVASGDLSHRLQRSSPAGYEPAAYRFDEAVVTAIDDNAPHRIIDIDHDLRRTAGECGYRSMLVALGAVRELAPRCEVLSYEAPFGVGYLVAQLTSAKAESGNAAADEARTMELPALARLAIETFVRTGKCLSTPDPPSALLAARAACFVSIKTNDGELRGCVGTIEPVKETLAEELIANAINAATRDPRFDPVSGEELGNLGYSVDVLEATEPADFADLDPKTYGVIVEDESKKLRGLLLPDIPGVESAGQQVEIAAHKAGIAAGAPLKLWRFRVDRYREK
jgi:AmmeMemoRadiSam system protein A/AmmeMemoRadiSam system protein B